MLEPDNMTSRVPTTLDRGQTQESSVELPSCGGVSESSGGDASGDALELFHREVLVDLVFTAVGEDEDVLDEDLDERVRGKRHKSDDG